MGAIENGKHVVTANKALIAVYGSEIFAAAEAKGVSVMYEAAVAVAFRSLKPFAKVWRQTILTGLQVSLTVPVTSS